MNLPDLNLLTALDVLLGEASVVKAARCLNLSCAAMSRTLKRLREAMGDPLRVHAGRTRISRCRSRGAFIRSSDAGSRLFFAPPPSFGCRVASRIVQPQPPLLWP